MSKHTKICIATTLLLLLVTATFSLASGQGSAETAISSAQDTLKNSYSATQQAYAAGANVTGLVDTLNTAAGLLSQAELAYASNDFNSAYSLATQSQSSLSGFVDQANAQQTAAQQATNQTFVFTLVSVVAAIAIFCGGLIGYIVLGRQERRSINAATKV